MPMTSRLLAVPLLVCCAAAAHVPALDAEALVQAEIRAHKRFPVPKIHFEAPCRDLPDYHFESEEVDLADWADIENWIVEQHGGPHRSVWREQAWGDESKFHLSDQLLTIFYNGKNYTYEQWLRSGREAPARQIFLGLNSTKDFVNYQCKFQPDHHDPLDCEWQIGGNLMCLSLDLMGQMGFLGDLQTLQSLLNKTFTDRMVNIAERGMLNTRWKKQNWGQWSKCEVTSNWENMKGQVVLGPEMKEAVEQACVYQEKVRENCDYYAYRGLWCQAMSIAAFEQIGGYRLTLAFEMVLPLTQDAYIIRESPAFSLLSDTLRMIVKDATELYEPEDEPPHESLYGRYMMSGGAKLQGVKDAWFANDVVINKAVEKCPGETDMEGCIWKERDYSLLQYAEKCGPYIIPEPDFDFWWAAEDKLMDLYAHFTYDWGMRQKVIVRWSENLIRVRTHRGNHHTRFFNEMKERILDSAVFIKVIERTCWPINHIRPNCWERATHDTLYMSILQVVADMKGSRVVFDQLLHKLQE